MSETISAWLAHPVTLSLAGVATVLLFVVIEVLLRSLAEIGNVRFQGMLEDHEGLLPVGPDVALHLSRVIDVLRWLQLGTIGVIWLIVFGYPGVDRLTAIVLCVALPVILVVLTRLSLGALAEDRLATLLRLVRPLASPLVALVARVGPGPQVPPVEDEEEEASDREIQAYLEAGQAAGIFEEEEGEIVESLVDFFDTVVREVMTPRTEMVAVPDTTSLEELLEKITSTHKSRIPVYHDTIDRVVGVVHVKNLVKHLMDGRRPPITELTHDCLVVPETKELGELLRDFQREHQQMGIVVDEYGGTSGLVTLEDILEEIVGEIQDEHEPHQPPDFIELEPGVYRLQGRVPLEVLDELYGLDLDEDDVDTVGGLVFARHGTVPESGTEVEEPSSSLVFTVDEMDERRIVSVTVRRVDDEAPEAEAPDPPEETRG
jgi:CBS domain containing-hemolysin-like protein